MLRSNAMTSHKEMLMMMEALVAAHCKRENERWIELLDPKDLASNKADSEWFLRQAEMLEEQVERRAESLVRKHTAFSCMDAMLWGDHGYQPSIRVAGNESKEDDAEMTFLADYFDHRVKNVGQAHRQAFRYGVSAA
jgi:hypothetical protein